jgi:two-component system chemotaxis response regulator CheB
MPAPRAPQKPCRVLLVDQGLRLGERARALFDTPGVVSSGQGAEFHAAVAAVEQQRPDVVVVELTHAAAFLAIQSIMAERPTPILVLRAAEQKHVDPFQALALGALDVAERPDPCPVEFWRELGRRLKLLSQIQVVRHVRGRRKSRANEVREEQPFPVVAIASSLGGPKALSILLRGVPNGFPAPICICQHISDGFTRGLAQWLSSETPLKVTEAEDGDPLKPGKVYIAPSGAHLLVGRDGYIQLDDGPPIMGFKPSCNALLSSVAEAFGPRGIGVILTGMGRDGAHGLLDIKSHGGRTIAQDEASCVVFGMPREAVELGAADQVLPLDEIAQALVRLAGAR